MNVIEFNQVWKKFKRGEKFNSLRDAIPYYMRLLTSGELNRRALGDREFWALENVTLHVRKGDIVGIIGPNGAGKSTILKLLSKIMDPDEGEIKINGRLSALIEITAGFHPDLTGRENVYLNGTILGMTRREIDRKFDEIVAFSGLGEFINTPVKRYSSGMFSRLGFSVAAHMDPDILLVDEVLSVGDMAFQSKCVRKMRELLDSGTTIVLVSHDQVLVQNLCKRVILLDEGKILKEGKTEDVIPFYHDLVYSKSEEDLSRAAGDFKVRVHEETKVGISSVSVCGSDGIPRKRYKAGEDLVVRITYEAREPVEQPVFSLDVVRSDGVLCCSSNTKEDCLVAGSIKGRGTVEIGLDRIPLAPGIYVLKIAIWDKDMLHPFIVRRNDVIRFEPRDKTDFLQKGVLITPFRWRSGTVATSAVTP